MTSTNASGKINIPNLDQLLVSDNPAWLWDGERTRIVWANHAGTQWFGAETLFDLLEIVFDTEEPGIADIKRLTSRLPRGQSAAVKLQFSAATTNQPLACTCYVHTLADGRAGLLVCADAVTQSATALPAAVQAMALGAFPLPICVMTGSGHMVFSNDALRDLLPARADDGFIDALAGDLIEKSLVGGLTTGLKSAETRHGKRDIRIISRPLEIADRLAESSFLLVLEDVTERRSLERSLLEAAEHFDDQQDVEVEVEVVPATAPEPSANVAEPSAPTAREQEPSSAQLDNEVVRALTSLRQEIEKQTIHAPQSDKSEAEAKPASAKSAKAEDRADISISVPDIVSSTLNSLPQPLVLVDQAGSLIFANDITVELMGVETWQDIGEKTTLGDALAALEGEDGSISLFTAKDEPVSLDVIMSTFPWKDGPVYQATLSPGSDGEEADNRRTVGSKKKLKK